MNDPAAPNVADPSRWRARVRTARPSWADEIDALAARLLGRDAVEATIARERGTGWRDEAHLNAGLRGARTRLFAAVIDRDLDGAADVGEVMGATTALAEAAIAEALAFHAAALARRHGVPHGTASGAPQDLVVVGMGKLGGGELNVSSDVDLVFLYEEDGETRPGDRADADARPVASAEFFARLGRKVIASLSDVTADGHVFRVDMRLRPDGDAGPLVVGFAMLERYLVASARDWERFAWVKGRVVSPPVFGRDVAADLERIVAPFVYRRYLDFGTIDALRRLHGRIRDEAVRREAVRRGRSSRKAAPPIDVKLGRGGIREIEFIAQHEQLVRGGRDPVLRTRPTRAALAVLVERGLLAADVGTRLTDAYAFLRNVEHRLQYLDDAQVHALPSRDDADACARVGAMCARLHDGAADFDGLVAALETHRAFVEARFDAIFGPARDTADTPDVWGVFADAPATSDVDPVVRDRLEALSFAPPDEAYARLAALARSPRIRSLPPSARARLDALVPRLVAAASRETAAFAVLARWLDLVEAIAGRSAYLALLDEFPAARAGVTRLLAASPWAAQYLARHPLLLDELIDAPDNDRPVRDAQAWREYWRGVAIALGVALDDCAGDAERQMDVLRETHHVETFRLLVDDLDGRLTIEALSDQLSALADLVIDAAVARAWTLFVAGRGDAARWPDTPAFAVIAFGKLGGKELGYASDLDLVFLFDPHGDPEAAATYARFAQRLGVWLTARTSAGALFDVDLRLRPDGAAGLVASSFDAWSRYERRERSPSVSVGAWTWEHQALTRARFAAGDRALGERFESERVAILASRTPDADGLALLRDEVVAMRARMHDGHPNRTDLFDLKHDDGGMVDVEFCVQYLVLAHGAAHPVLLDDAGNIALLARAADAGLVPHDEAIAVADAYRMYRARQHAVRLANPEAHAARVPPDDCVSERAAVRRLWRRLFA